MNVYPADMLSRKNSNKELDLWWNIYIGSLKDYILWPFMWGSSITFFRTYTLNSTHYIAMICCLQLCHIKITFSILFAIHFVMINLSTTPCSLAYICVFAWQKKNISNSDSVLKVLEFYDICTLYFKYR